MEILKVTCDCEEKFVDCQEDIVCTVCDKNNSVKETEEYLSVYIICESGGGSDAIKLFMCESCYKKHLQKIRKSKDGNIYYTFQTTL